MHSFLRRRPDFFGSLMKCKEGSTFSCGYVPPPSAGPWTLDFKVFPGCLCTRKALLLLCEQISQGNTRGGWSGHLGSGIPQNPCYKAGTSIMRRGFRPR